MYMSELHSLCIRGTVITYSPCISLFMCTVLLKEIKLNRNILSMIFVRINTQSYHFHSLYANISNKLHT